MYVFILSQKIDWILIIPNTILVLFSFGFVTKGGLSMCPDIEKSLPKLMKIMHLTRCHVIDRTATYIRLCGPIFD